MDTDTRNPKLDHFLRVLSAYVLLFIFALLALAIAWALRSDIFLVCVALSVQQTVTNFLYTWTTPLVILPWVLVAIGLEHYMNEAAQTSTVRRRALRVLAIEGGFGLVIFAVMGILALSGYNPIW